MTHKIDQALLGELGDDERRALHAALRGDDALRADYDRSALALRILEGEPEVAEYEIDLVEQWLVADYRPAPTGVVEQIKAWLGLRSWVSIAAAAAAALLLLWLVTRSDNPTLQQERDDAFGVRGGGPHTFLALEVLCDRGTGRMVAADEGGCDHDDTIAFDYRLDPKAAPAQGTAVLTLFGVDADGEPMFYAPTPDDPHAIEVKPGDSRAVGVGVRLEVNHAVGPLRVYGLVSPTTPTVDHVRVLAAALADQPPAKPGDDEWHERIAPELTAPLCPDLDDCHAAEVAFEVHASRSTPLRESAP